MEIPAQIYQGESFTFSLDVFGLDSREPLDVEQEGLEFIVLLSTSKFEPVCLPTSGADVSGDPFLSRLPQVPLSKEGSVLSAVVPADKSILFKPGEMDCEVRGLMADGWKLVGFIKGIAQVLPSMERR